MKQRRNPIRKTSIQRVLASMRGIIGMMMVLMMTVVHAPAFAFDPLNPNAANQEAQDERKARIEDLKKLKKAKRPITPEEAAASTYTPAQWQARLIEFAETVSPEPDALAKEFGVTWDITLRPNKDAPASPFRYFKSKSVNWKFEKSQTDFIFASEVSVNYFDSETAINSLSLLLPASRERCINFNVLHKHFSASPWKYVVKQSIYGGHHPQEIYYEKLAESGSTRVSMQAASGSNCLYFYAVRRSRVATTQGGRR